MGDVLLQLCSIGIEASAATCCEWARGRGRAHVVCNRMLDAGPWCSTTFDVAGSASAKAVSGCLARSSEAESPAQEPAQETRSLRIAFQRLPLPAKGRFARHDSRTQPLVQCACRMH